MKKALFIDRDGTLVVEPPVDYQLDSFEKLEFCPKVFRNLSFIRSKLDYEFVMVTNQDGLGTDSFPEDTFWPVHNLVLKTLEGEGITFDDILIDRSFPEDNAPTRKPRTGMMGKYMTGDYDLANSFVIGDRATDVELAKNLGCKAILLQDDKEVLKEKNLEAYCVLATTDSSGRNGVHLPVCLVRVLFPSICHRLCGDDKCHLSVMPQPNRIRQNLDCFSANNIWQVLKLLIHRNGHPIFYRQMLLPYYAFLVRN